MLIIPRYWSCRTSRCFRFSLLCVQRIWLFYPKNCSLKEPWYLKKLPESCRILEKAGFQFKGILRQNAIKNRQSVDMRMYAILRQDTYSQTLCETVQGRRYAQYIFSVRKWPVMNENDILIVSKAGRYGGGTYAHRNIAFEFASWLSPEFKYYFSSGWKHP